MFIHNGIRYRDEDAETLGYKTVPVPAEGDEAKARRDVANKARTAPEGDRAVTTAVATPQRGHPRARVKGPRDADGSPAAS